MLVVVWHATLLLSASSCMSPRASGFAANVEWARSHRGGLRGRAAAAIGWVGGEMGVAERVEGNHPDQAVTCGT